MTQQNPKLYRQMSEPHETMEALNGSIQAFFDEIGALREKHKLREVVVVVNTSYVSTSGEEIDAGTYVSLGNSLYHESMLAHTLGMVQARRQENIASLMTKGMRAGRKSD